MALNKMQEAFAVAVVQNGGDKVAAYKEAGYSLGLNPNAMSVQADKLYNHPKISLRIKELQEAAKTVAEEKFGISVEQRLEWLEQVVQAGLGVYEDSNGNERKENLPAVTSAIKTMNEMLGPAQDVNVNLTVSESLADRLKGGSNR